MRALFALGALLALCGGCGDEEPDPLSAKERGLVGTWDLEGAQGETFSFRYSFRSNGTVLNSAGGTFLGELSQLEGVEAPELRAVDGGFVNLRGRWVALGDTLVVTFRSVDVELFGEVPLAGRVKVPVYAEDLPGEEGYVLEFLCQLSGERLTLRGKSLSAAAPAVGGPDPIGRRALDLVAGRLAAAGGQATFERAE